MAKSKNKKKKFKDMWVNLTTLGNMFGYSSVQMGKLLKEVGLREQSGEPTQRAIAEGFCTSTPLKSGKPFFLWDKSKVSERLTECGEEKLSFKQTQTFELATAWMTALNAYEKCEEGWADKVYFMEADSIISEARKLNVVEQTNLILAEKKCKELLA